MYAKITLVSNFGDQRPHKTPVVVADEAVVSRGEGDDHCRVPQPTGRCRCPQDCPGLAGPASQPAVPDAAAGAQHLPPSPLPHRSFLVLCCGVAAAVAGVVVSVKRTRFRSTQWSTFFWADKTLI